MKVLRWLSGQREDGLLGCTDWEGYWHKHFKYVGSVGVLPYGAKGQPTLEEWKKQIERRLEQFRKEGSQESPEEKADKLGCDTLKKYLW